MWIDRATRSGASSPYAASIRVSVETGRPALAMSRASTLRCFGPPNLRGCAVLDDFQRSQDPEIHLRNILPGALLLTGRRGHRTSIGQACQRVVNDLRELRS